MDKGSKIVIIGAGIFGLSTAAQLAKEGYQNITILDRHMPPVPDGSSNDISRVVRIDYADEEYLKVAHQAYQRWTRDERYKGIFHSAPYLLVCTRNGELVTWIDKTTSALDRLGLPWGKVDDAAATKRRFPILSGDLAPPKFMGYYNERAGWVDAAKCVVQLRDDCLQLGVSFICGPAGTVTGLSTDAQNTIKSVRTLAGTSVDGDHFILTAGAWNAGLVPMYNSVLATAQVVGYTPLTDEEVEKYKDLPMYSNTSTGWFNFPPHAETKTLKFAIHGWGYTRTPAKAEPAAAVEPSCTSAPPPLPPRQRVNYCPTDGEHRLRQGLREILPELADRPFEKVAMCWYTDTPTGDFIMDYHPDYKNLFVGGAGSGHAFKFLPVLGEFLCTAIKRELPAALAERWRFRTEYANRTDTFLGDGSRGGPKRRELSSYERAKLSTGESAKL